MSEEWDWPPRRRWQPEIRTIPSNRPRFERVINHDPKPKTAWRWYVNQMRGGGSFLYKANVSALVFTAWGMAFMVIAIASALTVAILGKML